MAGLGWVGHTLVQWGAMSVAEAVSSQSHCPDLPKAAVCSAVQRHALSLPILQNLSPPPQKPGSRLFL